MAVNDVVRARVHGFLNNQMWQTGLHFQYLTVGADASGLIGEVIAELLPPLQAACTADVKFDKVSVDAELPPDLESQETGLTAGTAGTLSGASLPGQNAAVLSFRTGLKGRRRRGRMYVPAGANSGGPQGAWNPASLVLIDAIASAITTQWGSAGASTDYRHVTFSPENLTAVPARALNITTPVTSVIADRYVRTLRRRAIGVGQ